MTEVNIMIVEDEVILAKELRIKLENLGYYVTSIVNSGEKAIESSDQDRPDLILMDINLKSKMDGIEAAEIIHSRLGIPIIFLTAYADEDKLERAKITMPFGYILKPFTDKDLKVNIEMALYVARIDAERRHAEEELRNYKGHLEELVEERNALLLESNEQLQKEMEERKRAEEERRESQLQLFQSSKLVSLGEIAASLVHEMNQPLGGISLASQYIRRMDKKGQLTKEEIDSCLDDIDSLVTRMSKITQHIRGFARQDTTEFRQVNVNETIESALTLLNEQLRLRDITVTLELSPALPEIIGEPFQLEEVWINLVANARDALEEKQKKLTDAGQETTNYEKRLNISTSHNQDSEIPFVEVLITDNGTGLIQETKEKIFEPFFTTKEVGKGTGLGLSICHGIIESHKGDILMESKAGEGTTVRVILPIGD